MYHKLRWARRWLLVTTITMGTLYTSSCSLRDLRDATVSGGLKFVSGTITDSLGLLFPITDLLSLFTPNIGA